VLIKIPEGTKIDKNDEFAINEAFTSPQRKLRIPMASLEENVDNKKKVEEDRNHSMEACIVRIMKTRKTLHHTVLVGEVLQQLQFFKPQPKAIKQRIESLVERDYLERDAADANTYRYMA